MGRPGLTFGQKMEFYKGTGTQKLPLKFRPVYAAPTIQVTVDEAAYFGSAPGAFVGSPTAQPLVYGVDFCLQIDQPDGLTSRSGILWRINDYWPRPQVRQAGLLSPFIADDPGSIQVIYTAGYTLDNLPSAFRVACNTLVARLRYIFPLGMELGGEGYEERSISLVTEHKDYLLSLVKPMLFQYRNWHF